MDHDWKRIDDRAPEERVLELLPPGYDIRFYHCDVCKSFIAMRGDTPPRPSSERARMVMGFNDGLVEDCTETILNRVMRF